MVFSQIHIYIERNYQCGEISLGWRRPVLRQRVTRDWNAIRAASTAVVAAAAHLENVKMTSSTVPCWLCGASRRSLQPKRKKQVNDYLCWTRLALRVPKGYKHIIYISRPCQVYIVQAILYILQTVMYIYIYTVLLAFNFFLLECYCFE